MWVVVTVGTSPMGGGRGDRGEQRRVEPAADLIDPVVGLGTDAPTGGRGVLERHEVDRTALRGLDDPPGAASKNSLGRAEGCTPGGWVPARAVKRHREVHPVVHQVDASIKSCDMISDYIDHILRI